jgi:hypothetical protein
MIDNPRPYRPPARGAIGFPESLLVTGYVCRMHVGQPVNSDGLGCPICTPEDTPTERTTP